MPDKPRDLWSRRARVIDVHDGDTVSLYIDDGRDRYSTARARLYKTFAPELAQPGGLDTLDFVVGWLEGVALVASSRNWPLVVTTVRTRTDRDAETLGRYVYIVEDEHGASLNDAVISFVAKKGYPHGTGG